MRTSIPGVAQVVDGAGDVLVAAVAAIPPVVVSARCQPRLKVALLAYQYYVDTARIPTPVNMNYMLVLHKFYEQWEAIKTMKDATPLSVPLIPKHRTALKWM
mmetsp:Transcript_19836/g.27901  ORF Transcript_19836/g.27901 Transcript_19836/m.27901 type:complete len:102 (+) Transcript_19836:446-751(+)